MYGDVVQDLAEASTPDLARQIANFMRELSRSRAHMRQLQRASFETGLRVTTLENRNDDNRLRSPVPRTRESGS